MSIASLSMAVISRLPFCKTPPMVFGLVYLNPLALYVLPP